MTRIFKLTNNMPYEYVLHTVDYAADISYRAFACDVTAANVGVPRQKNFDEILLSTPIWPPSSLLFSSSGTECSRSI